MSNPLKSPWTGAVGVIVAVIVGAIGFAGPPPISGSTTTITPEQWLWVRWVVVAALFSGLQAFWASQRRIGELTHERNAALDALNRRRRNQALADLLTAEYRTGISEILNGPPVGLVALEQWRRRESAWTQNVLRIMREQGCTPQELNHVEMIGLFLLLALHQNETIARDLSMFAVRLQRVADISTSYANAGTTAV